MGFIYDSYSMSWGLYVQKIQFKKLCIAYSGLKKCLPDWFRKEQTQYSETVPLSKHYFLKKQEYGNHDK